MQGDQAAVGSEHQHLELGREPGDNIGGGVALGFALIGRLGGDEHHAGVGRRRRRS